MNKQSIASRKWQAKNLDKHRDIQRQAYHRRKEKDPIRQMLVRSRAGAKVRGIEFSITKEDLDIPTHCPVLGIELVYGGSGRTNASASIDRFDSSKGYVPGNVQIISWRANNVKNDSTIDELKMIVEWMETRQ